MGGYSRIRASGWASAGVMPRRMFSSAGMTRCDSISCSEWGRRFRLPTPAQHPRSRSSRRTRKNARVRAAIALSPVNMELPRGDPQQTFDHAGNPLPVLSFGDELFTAGLRNGVELGLPVILRRTPRSLNPTLLHQADKAEIDGSLVHQQRFLAELLDPAGNAIAVERPHRLQGFQNH